LIGIPNDLAKIGDTIEPLIRAKVVAETPPGTDVDRLVIERMSRARDLRPFRFRHHQPGGQIVEVIGKILPDGDLLTTFEDITERVHADSARQAASETLTAIIQASPMAIIVRDLMHRVIQWNSAAEHMLGWRADEILGRNYPIFPGDPEPDVAFGSRNLEPVHAERQELEITRTDGQALHIALWTTALQDLQGDLVGTLLIAEDIGDQKRAERAILEAKDAAESASRAKGEFLATVTHELKTPLHSVIGFTEIVERELVAAGGFELSLGHLEDIRHSGRQLLDLIEDVVDITRAESQELSISGNLISMPKLLRSAARPYAAAAANKSVELSIECQDGLPAITSDQRYLIRIVGCLMSNAIKFTESGGHVRLEAGMQHDGSLMISVIDSGIGMDPTQLTRIFDPFAQGDRRLSRRFEGLGLGLTLANKLAAALGLRLDFESAPGQGTRATIRIPAEQASAIGGALAG
jgi:PAS domain S-box-containing protein